LMYMDKAYVAQNKKMPVYDLGVCIFRDRLLRHPLIVYRARSSLLKSVEMERAGQLIDRALMKAILSMLQELGLGSLVVYEDEFETEFLRTTTEFYREEAQEFLARNTCPEYLLKVKNNCWTKSGVFF
jgi:hypothetical protein